MNQKKDTPIAVIGPQFISKKFTESCQEFGIYHERIPCLTPNKNAHIEAFEILPGYFYPALNG
ncbi:MAG: hypothetical protein ACOY31_08495 [Bacillota bacterium]